MRDCMSLLLPALQYAVGVKGFDPRIVVTEPLRQNVGIVLPQRRRGAVEAGTGFGVVKG